MANETAPEIKEASSAAIASVSFFIQSSEVLNQISIEAGQAAGKSDKIATLLGQFLGIGAAERLTALAEETKQPPILENKETLSAMKKRGLDIAALGLLLPLLLNDEARKYLASFIQGLIGAETLQKIETALKIAGVAIAAVFAVKVLKQVSDTLTVMMRIAKLTALLFGLTQATSDINEKDRKKIDRRREAEKRNRDKRKSKRRKKIERIRKIKGIVGKITTVLKATVIGAVAGLISGVVINTLIDYMINDDEKIAAEEDKAEDVDEDEDLIEPDLPEESDISIIEEKLKDNLIKAITFDIVNLEGVRNLGRVLQGDQATIEKNQAAIAGSVGTMGDTNPLTGQPSDYSETQPEIKPPPVSPLRGGPTRMGGRGSQSPIGPRPANPPLVPQPQTQAVPEPQNSTNGSTLSTASENVGATRKDLTAGSNSTTIIDNSTIHVVPEQASRTNAPASTSLSVGR